LSRKFSKELRTLKVGEMKIYIQKFLTSFLQQIHGQMYIFISTVRSEIFWVSGPLNQQKNWFLDQNRRLHNRRWVLEITGQRSAHQYLRYPGDP
jgi:hypothetical protein